MQMLSNYQAFELEDQIVNVARRSIEGAGEEAVATYALPVVVFGMMLYAVKDADEQVEDLVKNENTQTGVSQGSIMGMLGWKWRQVDERFLRKFVLQVYEREKLNELRVTQYNLGLRGGYHYAATLSPAARKGTLKVSKILGRRPRGLERARSD